MEEKKKAGSSGLSNYMANPRAYTLKRWLYELLKEKYSPHEKIAERLGVAMQTDHDIQDLGKLLGEIFEAGYRKAVDDYKVEAEKVGLKVHVVPSS